jgi:ribosomal-protein-alanine N-acetyltransferase
MTLAHVSIIGDLEQACFAAPWPAATYERELRHNRLSQYWVIRPSVQSELPPILAYGGYWQMGDEAHIVTIATHPDWRRRGLSEWLLLEMMAVIRTQAGQAVTLEVRAGNEAAQALYRKLGFDEVGRRKRYYRDNGEDALLFTFHRLDEGAVWQPLARRLSALRQTNARLETPPR